MARRTIQGPPAAPPLYSLLQAADLLEDGERWQDGVQWAPEQPFAAGVTTKDCHGSTPGLGDWAQPAVQHADPFVVYAEDHCSTIGFEARDYEGRARRQLAAKQSALIAEEVQTGNTVPANAALDEATEVGPAGSSVPDAIAILEQEFAAAWGGARGMLHVTPQVFTLMMSHNMIYLAGQKWLTAPGTVVAMDAGYKPEGSTTFAYATALMQVRLSPVVVDPFETGVDHRLNKIRLYAERLALVQWDYEFDTDARDLMFKIEVDVPLAHLGS